MISTRGRYALRVLADLAEHDSGEFIPLKEVADRQRISLKYIERIMPVLTKNGYVLAMHGKGGGYKMLKSPKDCTIGDILRLTEGLAGARILSYAGRRALPAAGAVPYPFHVGKA